MLTAYHHIIRRLFGPIYIESTDSMILSQVTADCIHIPVRSHPPGT